MTKWCSADAIGLLLSDRELTTVRIMALEREEEKTKEKREGGENEDGIEGEHNKMTSV